jgi:hypothetical protein
MFKDSYFPLLEENLTLRVWCYTAKPSIKRLCGCPLLKRADRAADDSLATATQRRVCREYDGGSGGKFIGRSEE